MRMMSGIIFFACYVAWVLYRLVIKRDMKHHLNDLLGLTFFIAVWGLIYYFLFHKA